VSDTLRKKVLLLGSDSLGRGDETLGRMLMANFLRLLGEEGRRPDVICCVNYGVKLAVRGSACLGHLKHLATLGTKILLCRTCVEYFDLEDQVEAGEISNMPTIQGHMITGDVIPV
jgi:selenium metabolism protein YedF